MSNSKMFSKGKSVGPSRREFITTTSAAVAAAAISVPGKKAVAAGKSANDKLGIGIIGVGGRAGAHMKALHWLKTQGNENIEIVAVCDVYRPRMQKAIKGYAAGAKTYMDHRQLLADPNVDVVCIATPDHHHGYQALDALEAGKDIYCEKPITHWRQFELTKKLAAKVAESKQVFQLGTQGMYDSAWQQMKKYVQQGLIGQPIHAECGYFRVGDWGERGMPIDDPNAKPGPDLDWEAFLGDSPKRPFDVSRFFRWRMYEDYAGGPVTDLYPHSLTPVVSILGLGMPEKVVATGGKFRYSEREVPDTFNMMIDYAEKVTIVVMGTQGNNYRGTGSRGAGSRVPVIRGWEGTLTVKGNNIVFIPTPPDDYTVKTKKEEQTFPIEHGEDFIEYWRNFLSCVRTRKKETLSPMGLAYNVQTALQMGMLSYRAEKTARFDAENEKILI